MTKKQIEKFHRQIQLDAILRKVDVVNKEYKKFKKQCEKQHREFQQTMKNLDRFERQSRRANLVVGMKTKKGK